jgi:hypothetical protein
MNVKFALVAITVYLFNHTMLQMLTSSAHVDITVKKALDWTGDHVLLELTVISLAYLQNQSAWTVMEAKLVSMLV